MFSVIQHPLYHQIYTLNKVPVFKISSNENLNVSLLFGTAGFVFNNNDIVIETRYTPDSAGMIEINFEELFVNYVKTKVQDTESAIIQNEFICGFKAVIKGETSLSSVSHEWAVANISAELNQSFDNFVAANFLSIQPVEKYTSKSATEWLTYFDSTGSATLEVKFYKTDNTIEQVSIYQNENAGAYSVNVSFTKLIKLSNCLPNELKGYYDVILCDIHDNVICTQRYIYRTDSGQEKYFLFVNAVGGIDTITFEGESILSPELSFSETIIDNRYCQVDESSNHKLWSQSGIFPTSYQDWIYDFATSSHRCKDYNDIIVTDYKINVSDNEQVNTITFSYHYADNMKLSAQRNKKLHESTARSADSFDNLMQSMNVEIIEDGIGGFTTNQNIIPPLPTNKLYIDFEAQASTEITWLINNNPEGSFVSDEPSPFVIELHNSDHGNKISFASDNGVAKRITIYYYN